MGTRTLDRYLAREILAAVGVVLFGFLAGVTRRLGLATGILILPQRQTALVAKQAAAVDVLASGRLRLGVTLNDGPALPVPARLVAEPGWLWPRDPPIRQRKAIPTAWIELELAEGKDAGAR